MKKTYTLLSLLLAGQVLTAQEPILLKDFSTGGADAFIYDPVLEGVLISNQFFFVVDDGKHGEELWRTNGTTAGTQLVRDINPGEVDSYIEELTAIGDRLFFRANDDEHGSELWTSQGTASSTQVIDIHPETGSVPANFVVLDGVLYFAASGDQGRELYRSEGSVGTTTLVKNINPGVSFSGSPYGSLPSDFTIVGDQIFFRANDGEHGNELWKTDGTPGGTVMVKDISEGQFSTSLADFKNGGNVLFFTVDDAVNGRELWISDGTEEGTGLVRDITPGADDSNITMIEMVNNVLYFIVRESFTERFLWKTDGSENGTKMVGDGINTREYFLHNGVLYFKGNNGLWRADGSVEERITDFSIEGEFGGTEQFLYFSANGSEGQELWKTDGTTEGTSRIRVITDASYRYIQNFNSAGSKVYFTAETEESGNELWTSDGTEEGTFLLHEAVPGEEDGYPSYYEFKTASLGDLLLFVGRDEEHGYELWKSDGSPEGTSLVKDINTATGDIRLSGAPVSFNGATYFLTDEGMWRTDGNPDNAELIYEAVHPSGLNLLNDQLLFSAQAPGFGRTIIQSDGTPGGTLPLFEGDTTAEHLILFQQDLPVLNGELYFMGRHTENGYELWKTDGTPEGTGMVKDIFPGQESSISGFSENDFAILNGILYFAATDPEIGRELYRSDGTEAGTIPVVDISPFGSSSPRDFLAHNEVIYFVADDGTSGRELWRSDGTSEGTYLVKDIFPGEDDGMSFTSMISFQGLLYFSATDDEFGRELWRSDGTEEGTYMVKDIRPPFGNFTRSSNPSDFTIFNNSLFFTATTENGNMLYTTDGTEEGTQPALDMEVSRVFEEALDNLFFSSDDGEHGLELWRLRGLEADPVMIHDIFPGMYDSDPRVLGFHSGSLYFTARDGVHGNELWTLTPHQMEVVLMPGSEHLCSPEDTAAFEVSLESTGIEPEYVWFLNNMPLPGQTGSSYSVSGLVEDDEIRVLAIAGDDQWIVEDSVFSEPVVISYDLPVADITVSGNTLIASEGAAYEWYRDDELLPFDTQSITVEENGTYQVRVTNESGCSALSEKIAVVISGIDSELAGKVRLYPNPASSLLYIESQLNERLLVSLTSIRGDLVLEEALESGTAHHVIPMEGIAPGIYLVSITGESGSIQFKLIRQ